MAEPLVVQREDPFPGQFTECVTCANRAFIVFPGPVDDATFVLRRTIDALFSPPPPLANVAFLTEARGLLLLVMTLSDGVARRAGLPYGVDPQSVLASVVMPADEQSLSRGKQAVYVPRKAWVAMCNACTVSPETACLLVRPVNVDLPDLDDPTIVWHTRPIVETEDGYIVAVPGMLLLALHRALMRLATLRGAREAFANAYNDALWNSATASLFDLWHWPVPPLLPAAQGLPGCREGFFTLDTDKLAYTVLLPDPLEPGDDDVPWARSLQDLSVPLQERLLEVVSAMKVAGLADGVLLLVFLQSMGGQGRLQLDEALIGQPVLLLSVADVQTLGLLECRCPLLLWQFARAAMRIRRHVEVVALSMFDEFAHYRGNGYGYPHADGPEEEAVFFFGAHESGALRRTALRKRSWHGVPSFDDGVIEVMARYDTPAVPIYTPTTRLLERVALLVEGFALPVWIIGPAATCGEDLLRQEGYLQFASLIAYWLWQCAPALTPLFVALKSRFPQVRIHLRIGSPYLAEALLDGPLVEIHPDPHAGMLHVRLREGIRALLNASDNSGEMALMTRVVHGLVTLVPDSDRRQWLDGDIALLLQPFAIPPWKKHALVLPAKAHPMLDQRGIPEYRALQEADRQDVLEDLASYLLGEGGLRPGPIDPAQAKDVLNGMVKWLFGKLKAIVSSLEPEDLLEGLIAYQESATQEAANHAISGPAYRACWNSVPELLAEFDLDSPSLALTLLASRFIIEYVIAQPPAGDRVMSLATYDRLQALAALLIDIGRRSDLLKYGLDEAQLFLHPSGRLVTAPPSARSATATFIDASREEERARAIEGFPRWWDYIDGAPARSALFDQLDAACVAEFNFTFTDLQRLLTEAANFGGEIDPAVACMPREQVVVALAQRLTWSPERVSAALDLLTICPRSNFLNPGGLAASDVYPWRFNRALSYLRRPFLQRDRAGVRELLWGSRHIANAQWYLWELLRTGRLHARSKAMLDLLSMFCNEQGKRFNDEVADLLGRKHGLIVHRRVRDIGLLKGMAGPPGDIDVLVAQPDQRRVLVLECKDLVMGRMPHELAVERDKLFRGQGGGPSAIEKHLRRVAWVREHLDAVVAWLNLGAAIGWEVEGMVVLDQELLTPYLENLPTTIVTLDRMLRMPW